MATPSAASEEAARFVFLEWDRRARSRDTAGLLDLYAEDASRRIAELKMRS